MGKKRKSSGNEAQDSALAKRIVLAAQPGQSSKPAIAAPASKGVKNREPTVTGAQKKGGSKALNSSKGKGSAIDDMFGALKSAKQKAAPVVAAETLHKDELVRPLNQDQ